MNIQIEAAPFIETVGNYTAKNEVYNSLFEVEKLANKLGKDAPLKFFGFWESDDAYAKRLGIWKEQQKRVLFHGWEYENFTAWEKITHKEMDITIKILVGEYSIKYRNREFKFPSIPETIDDFINDCKRVGVKLFWKDSVIEKYGIRSFDCNFRVIDYYSIIDTAKRENDLEALKYGN